MMSQWWLGPHLDHSCLVMCTPYPLLKPQGWNWGRCHRASFFFFSPWLQRINYLSFLFCFDLSLQLACYRWGVEPGLLVLHSPGSDPKNSDNNMVINVCSPNLLRGGSWYCQGVGGLFSLSSACRLRSCKGYMTGCRVQGSFHPFPLGPLWWPRKEATWPCTHRQSSPDQVPWWPQQRSGVV